MPLAGGSHADVVGLPVVDGAALVADARRRFDARGLRDRQRFVGYRGDADEPSAVLLENNGLAIELVIDRRASGRRRPIGPASPTWCSSRRSRRSSTSRTRSPPSTAHDKVGAYRNWLGLMQGDLTETVTKAGRTFTRRLADDRTYTRCRRLAWSRSAGGRCCWSATSAT